MNVLDVGHKYELANFENPSQIGQVLQFIKKELVANPTTPGELRTVANGTTNEEVLRVLIDRLATMQAKFPCRENAIASTHIETALLWLEKRTADRKTRGVEGKHIA